MEKLLDQVKKLNQSVVQDSQTNAEFRDALVKLCTEFKGDIKYLDRALREFKLDFKNTVRPTSHLFGSISIKRFLILLVSLRRIHCRDA